MAERQKADMVIVDVNAMVERQKANIVIVDVNGMAERQKANAASTYTDALDYLTCSLTYTESAGGRLSE